MSSNKPRFSDENNIQFRCKDQSLVSIYNIQFLSLISNKSINFCAEQSNVSFFGVKVDEMKRIENKIVMNVEH